MFDSNIDSKNGVSIWDHVLDGAATGGIAGSVLPVAGNIAGAIGGGLVGLANGLWESHQESSAFDEFYGNGKKQDAKTVARLETQLEAMALDPTIQGMGDEEFVKQGMNRVFLQDYAAKEQKETNWFNDLF